MGLFYLSSIKSHSASILIIGCFSNKIFRDILSSFVNYHNRGAIMASIFSQYMTDKSLEKDGVWVEFSEVTNDDGTTPAFLLSRVSTNNRKWVSRTQPIYKQLERVSNGDLDIDKVKNVSSKLIRAFCEIILLDWRDFKKDGQVDKKGNFVIGEDGKVVCEEVPFDTETAYKLLSDMPDLYAWLMKEAMDIDNYLSSNREKDLNS